MQCGGPKKQPIRNPPKIKRSERKKYDLIALEPMHKMIALRIWQVCKRFRNQCELRLLQQKAREIQKYACGPGLYAKLNYLRK
jgi:hypothetical protein